MPANLSEEAPAWCSTRFTQRLGITYPIIQGPFAGVSTHRLTALVSNIGGLGSIGAHDFDDSAIHEAIDQVRSETDKPLAVNLFVSTSDTVGAKIGSEEIARKISLLAPYYAELGVTPPVALQPKIQDFERQVRAAIDSRAPVLSFIYGIPPTEVIEECRRRAIPTLATATTADETRALEQAGFDLIVASGFEAGGHRGSFLRAAADSLTGSLSLIPQVVDAVSVPVIAAGGIADGRGHRGCFLLGCGGSASRHRLPRLRGVRGERSISRRSPRQSSSQHGSHCRVNRTVGPSHQESSDVRNGGLHGLSAALPSPIHIDSHCARFAAATLGLSTSVGGTERWNAPLDRRSRVDDRLDSGS